MTAQPSLIPPSIDEQIRTLEILRNRLARDAKRRVNTHRWTQTQVDRELDGLAASIDTLVQLRGVRHVRKTLAEIDQP